MNHFNLSEVLNQNPGNEKIQSFIIDGLHCDKKLQKPKKCPLFKI